jgi:hypothetical protein
MPKEPEGYREQLEDIHRVFGGKGALTVTEVIRYTGLNKKTVAKRYGVDRRGITNTQLALRMTRYTNA